MGIKMLSLLLQKYLLQISSTFLFSLQLQTLGCEKDVMNVRLLKP